MSLRPGERPAEGHLVGVLQVAPDRQAAGEPRDPRPAAQAVGQIGGGRLAGHGRVGRQEHLGHTAGLDSRDELGDPQVLGVDAVDRRERPAEDVVEAAVLVRPFQRDQVGRILDHADQRPVAAGVGADRAQRPLRQVAALGARPDPLLHLADRVGQREGVGLRGLEQVERQPLGRAPADAGQAGELDDQVVDRRGVHRLRRPTCRAGRARPVRRAGPSSSAAAAPGRPRSRRSRPRSAGPAASPGRPGRSPRA